VARKTTAPGAGDAEDRKASSRTERGLSNQYASASPETRAIDDIRVVDRHRCDRGDIDALAESIAVPSDRMRKLRPEKVNELAESIAALFAREARPGWDSWGNEVPQASEAAE